MKWRPWIEILVVYGALTAALWSDRPAQQVWHVLTALLVLGFTLAGRRSARELGLGMAGLRGALWVIPAAAAVAGLMLFVGWAAGWLHAPAGKPPYTRAVFYTIWALQQQFMAQSFFFVRLEAALQSGRKAVLGTALLFSAAHLPSPVLAPATLLAGLLFSEVFRRYRTIYPLAVAHAMLGLALAMSVPAEVHRNMRVGLGYLRFLVN